MKGKAYSSNSNSNADSFGTFLENMQNKTSATSQPEGTSQQPQPQPRSKIHTANILTILTLLAELGPSPVAELMVESNLSVEEFLEAFKKLQDTGLITLAGQPKSQKVELTPRGEELAQLAELVA